MDEDNVYCMWVSLVAGLLSLLGIIIFSQVWPIVSLKLKERKKSNEMFNLNAKMPNQLQLGQRYKELEGSLPHLNATLALAETKQSTSYYKLLCPVYIAEPNVTLVKEEESTEINLDVNVKKDEASVKVMEERKSDKKSKPRATESSTSSSSSSSDSDSSSSSEPSKTVSLKRKTKKRSTPRKKAAVKKKSMPRKKPAIVTQGKSSTKTKSKKSPAEKQNVLKDEAQDVKTRLVIQRDPKDRNKLDIDYNMIIDPDSKQPMEVHTHAEVDEDKMNVIGTAVAEGAGYADVEGTIQHKGAEDQDDFRLDVMEKKEDRKEISLQATIEQKQEQMKQKKI